MQTFPFSWILLAQLWLLRSCGLIFKSPLIKTCFLPDFYFCSANDPRTDKGTNLAFKPPLLRLLVNLGCIQSSPLRGKVRPCHFHVIDSWRLVSDIHKLSVFVRLDCDSGWVHSSRPWVLHSRRRWQEWVCVCVGGGGDSKGSNLRHLFYWLVGCQSHHDYHTRPGQTRGAMIHLRLLLLSRMAEIIN